MQSFKEIHGMPYGAKFYSDGVVTADPVAIKKEVISNSGKWVKNGDFLAQASTLQFLWLSEGGTCIKCEVYTEQKEDKFDRSRVLFVDTKFNKAVLIENINGNDRFTIVSEIATKKLWNKLQEFLKNDVKVFDCEVEFMQIIQELDIEIKASNGRLRLKKT